MTCAWSIIYDKFTFFTVFDTAKSYLTRIHGASNFACEHGRGGGTSSQAGGLVISVFKTNRACAAMQHWFQLFFSHLSFSTLPLMLWTQRLLIIHHFWYSGCLLCFMPVFTVTSLPSCEVCVYMLLMYCIIFCCVSFRPELKENASIVRELHVYGSAVPVHSRDPRKFQHQVTFANVSVRVHRCLVYPSISLAVHMHINISVDHPNDYRTDCCGCIKPVRWHYTYAV